MMCMEPITPDVCVYIYVLVRGVLYAIASHIADSGIKLTASDARVQGSTVALLECLKFQELQNRSVLMCLMMLSGRFNKLPLFEHTIEILFPYFGT